MNAQERETSQIRRDIALLRERVNRSYDALVDIMPAAGVTNPMTANLDADDYNITDIGDITAETLTLSLTNAISFERSGYNPLVFRQTDPVGSSVGDGLHLYNETTSKYIMHWQENGDVGIGTGSNSVDARLHVYDDSSKTEIFMGLEGSTDKAGIVKYVQGDGTGTGQMQIGNWGDNLRTDGLVIDKGGNIGAGTDEPAARIDIADHAMRFEEMTAPSAPAANSGVTFMQDNGAGKTQYCVRFSSGAIQVIATQP